MKPEYNETTSNLSRKSFQKLRDTTCLRAKDGFLTRKKPFFHNCNHMHNINGIFP